MPQTATPYPAAARREDDGAVTPRREDDGATTPREDDEDSFHSVDEFKTPPRNTPRKKDGDNYKKRFKELQKHARELVRRHAALEAELAEARAALEVARAREVSDGGSEPYERPPRCELHAALEAERYRAAAAEDEVRRLSLALRVMKDVKNVDVARRRRRSGRALSRALLQRAAAASGVATPERYDEAEEEVVDDGWLLGRLGARGDQREEADDVSSDDSNWIDINVDVVDVHASPTKVRRSPGKARASPKSDLLVAGDGLLRKARTLLQGKSPPSSPSPARRPFARPWRSPPRHATITPPVAARATGASTLDADAVAAVLSGLGPAYATPAKTLREASCDGAFLNTLSAADLAATLADAGLGPVQARRARHALGLSPCSKNS
mmetsp:Transcript_2975/g.7210  ORF Transcript_2975/g.7210 Transcript_2975/m.7210 type:complete len:384 (+) Transcript_2975:127-1278(+)